MVGGWWDPVAQLSCPLESDPVVTSSFPLEVKVVDSLKGRLEHVSGCIYEHDSININSNTNVHGPPAANQ